MSWFCKCGMLCSGLNYSCYYKGSAHYQVSDNTPDFLMAVVASKGLQLMSKGVKLSMTEQEELYAKFYNMGKLLVKDMDMTALDEHIAELSQIAFQAKATLASAQDEKRERRAKVEKKDWLVTPTQPNQAHTDAINAVKIRKGRMTAIDKMREQLEDAGLPDEIINDTIRKMERNATDKTLRTLEFPRKKETTIVKLELKKPETKVFDASSLDFLNKNGNSD